MNMGRGSWGVAGVCALLLLLALPLFLATRGPAPGDGQFSVDGIAGTWRMGHGDARFRRVGTGTDILLRAHDGPRAIELSGSFLGAPSDPVFIGLAVNYTDGQGRRFERTAHPGDGAGIGTIDWERLALTPGARVGRARVALDVRVCSAGERCHRVAGHFNARPLVEEMQDSLL